MHVKRMTAAGPPASRIGTGIALVRSSSWTVSLEEAVLKAGERGLEKVWDHDGVQVSRSHVVVGGSRSQEKGSLVDKALDTTTYIERRYSFFLFFSSRIMI